MFAQMKRVLESSASIEDRIFELKALLWCRCGFAMVLLEAETEITT